MKIEKKGRLNLLIAGLCLALGLVGWRTYAHRALNPHDYTSYYADNRAALSDTKVTEGIALTLTHQPFNLLVINDLGETMTRGQYEESKNNFCEHLYFTLDISRTDPLSMGGSKALRDYFSHDRQRQFVLVGRAGDTLACTLYHPELVNRADKQVRVNLVFPRPTVVAGAAPCDTPLSDDVQVRFYDETTHQFISFRIKKEAINELPALKF